VVLDSYADEIAELPLGMEFLQLVNGLTILAAVSGGLQFLTRAENLTKIKGSWAKVKNLLKTGTRAEIEAGFIAQLELAEQIAERSRALRTTEELTEFRKWLRQLEDEGKLTAELRGQAEVAAARYVEEVEKELNKVFVDHMFAKFGLKQDKIVQVKNGVYDAPGRIPSNPTEAAIYQKEIDFAEQICANEKRKIVMAPESEPAIDGFDLETGTVIQLKQLDNPDNLMRNINTAYTKAVNGPYAEMDLYVLTSETMAQAQLRFSKGLKQPSISLKNDGTINKIIVYCTDGQIELIIP
jgi:hypothetical protein